MEMSARSKTTYFFERWRAISTGITETASSTFLLLIAVRWFEAGANWKAIIAGASSFGYLLAPFVVHRVEKSGISVSKAASYLYLVSSLAYLLCVFIPNLIVFAIGSVLAVLSLSTSTPLIIQMYQENYPHKVRGRMFSRSVMIKITIVVLLDRKRHD